MKTIGTDGKNYILNPPKNSKEIEDTNRSLLHLEARDVVKKCFPNAVVYEEVILTGCRGNGGTLTADFFIPDMQILIEVHGAQHYKFVKYFHNSPEEFENSKRNDIIKKLWAENNDIIYIELPYDQIKNWGKIINGHIS